MTLKLGYKKGLGNNSSSPEVATMCTMLAQQLTDQVTISRKRKPGETSTSPVLKKSKVVETRTYSNSLSNCIKTFCCECDQVVNLSGMQKHLKRIHQQSIMEYRKIYGNPQKQVIQMVYHSCSICQEDVVLDYQTLLKHLRKHKTNMSKYSSQYMTTSSALVVRPIAKEVESPKVVQTPSLRLEKETQVTITRKSSSPECSSCSRAFRSNMELKMHNRRLHA